MQKKGRTNSTLTFNVDKLKYRRQGWQQPERFTMTIPHEKPKVSLPITIFAMAFGWSISDFVRAVRMFLGPDNKPEVEGFMHIVATDVDGCRTQQDAIRRIGKCLKRCQGMTNEVDIFFVCVLHSTR